MKPREIIAATGIGSGAITREKMANFMNVMDSEAKSLIENFNVNDDIGKFHKAVKIIRQKWDGVSLRVPYGLDEKHWSAFYAKTIVPLRDKLCPTWYARKKYYEDKMAREQAESESKNEEIVESED